MLITFQKLVKLNQLVHPLQAEILCDLVFPQVQKKCIFIVFALRAKPKNNNNFAHMDRTGGTLS